MNQFVRNLARKLSLSKMPWLWNWINLSPKKVEVREYFRSQIFILNFLHRTISEWVMIPCPLKPVCAQYCNEFRVFENLAKLKKDNKKSKKSKSSEVTKKPAFIKKKKLQNGL